VISFRFNTTDALDDVADRLDQAPRRLRLAAHDAVDLELQVAGAAEPVGVVLGDADLHRVGGLRSAQLR